MIEPSADVAPSAIVAPSARVWHLAQVREDAHIGEETIVGRGAYIGEGVRVGAGAVVTRDVAAYALVVGVPARRVGWVGEAGVPLVPADEASNEAGASTWVCPASGRRYVERDGALSPEKPQASSPHADEMPAHTREDQQ